MASQLPSKAKPMRSRRPLQRIHHQQRVRCGYRIEDIENPLTRKVRILDKLVDELARGRALDRILR
jgi:hypothetical protein